MKLLKSALPVAAIAIAVAGTFAMVSSSTTAQQPTGAVPTKVAIVNPARVFNDMQETKDLKVKIETELKGLEDQKNQKTTRLRALQDERNILRPDSPQYADKSRELAQAAVEYEVWGKMSQMDVQRNQLQQMKTLFDKIQAATAAVASQRGWDLVLADQRPDFPANLEQLNVDQLRALINQRNVLYAVPSVDLSAEVTAQLDSDYKNKK